MSKSYQSLVHIVRTPFDSLVFSFILSLPKDVSMVSLRMTWRMKLQLILSLHSFLYWGVVAVVGWLIISSSPYLAAAGPNMEMYPSCLWLSLAVDVPVLQLIMVRWYLTKAISYYPLDKASLRSSIS